MAKKHHHRVAVAPHHRKAPTRKPAYERAPMPGQHEFSPEEEQAMRHGQRDRMAAQAAPMADMDEDDAGMAGPL